jgi:hypothetical protein
VEAEDIEETEEIDEVGDITLTYMQTNTTIFVERRSSGLERYDKSK